MLNDRILYFFCCITNPKTMSGFDCPAVSDLSIAVDKTADIIIIIFQKNLFVIDRIIIHFPVFANGKTSVYSPFHFLINVQPVIAK